MKLTSYQFKLIKIMIVLLAIMILIIDESVHAQDYNYQFDIFQRDSFLIIQPNLSSFINSEKISLLREGVNYTFEYQITILRPRKLWGAVQIEQRTEAVAIGYRLLTEEYTLSRFPIDTLPKELRFISLAGFHQYLSDSIEVRLLKSDLLNEETSYKVELKTTTIALTTLNLISSENNYGESPVKFLFRQFLDLTSYGREEKTITSGLFKISDLEIIE